MVLGIKQVQKHSNSRGCTPLNTEKKKFETEKCALLICKPVFSYILKTPNFSGFEIHEKR